MTMRKTSTVAITFERFGRPSRMKICFTASSLFGLVMSRWKTATMAPSNCIWPPCEMVIGESICHTMFSQMFVTRKRFRPPQMPQPFCSRSSSITTTRPATKSCAMMAKAVKAPSVDTGPYTPEST